MATTGEALDGNVTMIVKSLDLTDHASDFPFGEERINNPSVEQVEEAVRSLNGKSRSCLGLHIDEDHYLAVGGGGGGHYVVQFFPDMFRLINSNVSANSDREIRLVVDQKGWFSEKECVPTELALQAARHYALTGQMDKDLNWEQYA
jgi:hypothetical protein